MKGYPARTPPGRTADTAPRASTLRPRCWPSLRRQGDIDCKATEKWEARPTRRLWRRHSVQHVCQACGEKEILAATQQRNKKTGKFYEKTSTKSLYDKKVSLLPGSQSLKQRAALVWPRAIVRSVGSGDSVSPLPATAIRAESQFKNNYFAEM